jgi:transcriptional regulator with XRE-family HTH domain
MFGDELKRWRSLRRLSQEDLGAAAGVSARHLSCLERGIALPSKAMVLRLAAALDLPLREQNGLLGAAGYAQKWQDAGDTIPLSLQPAIDAILKNQPFPAYALNGRYEVLDANPAGWAMLRLLKADAARGMNVAEAMLASGPHRDMIEDYAVTAKLFLTRLRAEAVQQGPRSTLWPIIGEAQKDPLIRSAAGPDSHDGDPVFPLSVRALGQRTSWLTVLLTFGSPMDAMVEHLVIEQFLPADEETRRIAEAFLA